MSDTKTPFGTGALFVGWWGLATVALRLLGEVTHDPKGWPTCAALAAASVAVGELSDRWRRRRLKAN
ncbi:hypothetical protein [Streptomyces sp. NPDC056549]|uniref:hypothetical protein n=1 Tax=Streptomyces sp. NPDC056549 TaxID=3345864 RepID=UPI0036A0F669